MGIVENYDRSLYHSGKKCGNVLKLNGLCFHTFNTLTKFYPL